MMEEKFFRRALELAKQAEGFTSPNPCVGAVIVKGGHIVSEGWHKAAGEEHAEVMAIRLLMEKSGIQYSDLDPGLFQNAELYVTLEPCSHVGKTGACAEVVARAGFKKIYVGMKDPSKKVNGKGIKMIEKAGVKVEVLKQTTDLALDIRKLNQPFIKHSKLGLPYVTLKAGMSLDGKIATAGGEAKWITSEADRDFARLERSKCDAVIVGAGTVKADDCELAAHGIWKEQKLLRVIIDRKLSCSLKSKVFRDENVLVACTDLASKAAKDRFKRAGVKVKSFGKDKVSVKRLLKYLAEKDVLSVFVEGGSVIHGVFHDAALRDQDLLDEILFIMAPKLIGGDKSLSVIGGDGAPSLKKALDFVNFDCEKAENSLRLRAILNRW